MAVLAILRLRPERVAAPARTGFCLISASAEASRAPDTQENEIVSQRFISRNPRNLERLALARKDNGWQTTWPRHSYWHRLRFRKTQKHVTACVEAASSQGEVVISASTQEWSIKKHLHSTRDVTAAETVGRVLAQRCLEAGIGYLQFRAIPWEYRAESVQRFRSALKDGGLILSEPRRVYKSMNGELAVKVTSEIGKRRYNKFVSISE
ncbi:39S ribosomal protein L18, mitochondrial [Stegostoma tigrinum]|uniref:39S ribosomal protein L18, mitochondrial n=1 Tax=Stegostoma tigrinum TaxID=3053191 RepID=UPI00202AEB75|nr:39S ribosomal protein L18, mitochondrial [Stegostoma tigrinum]